MPLGYQPQSIDTSIEAISSCLLCSDNAAVQSLDLDLAYLQQWAIQRQITTALTEALIAAGIS